MTPSCVEWKLRLRTVQHESTVNMSDFLYQFLVNPQKNSEQVCAKGKPKLWYHNFTLWFFLTL